MVFALFCRTLSFFGPQAADTILKPFKTINFPQKWVLLAVAGQKKLFAKSLDNDFSLN